MSALRTAIGAAGVGFGGSPFEIVADSAATARRDIEVLKMNASQRIYDTSLQGQSQERQYLFDAQAAQFKGNEAFGTLLGGFGQAVGQRRGLEGVPEVSQLRALTVQGDRAASVPIVGRPRPRSSIQRVRPRPLCSVRQRRSPA